MADSLANDEVQGQGVQDESGQKVVRGQEEKSCGVKQTLNEMPNTLNKEERNICRVNKMSHREEGEEQEINKLVLKEEEMELEGGQTWSEMLDRLNSKEEGKKQETKEENAQKTTQQKEDRKQELVQTLNELSDSSEMSGTVSESSQSDSGRLSPTLFLPEARVRFPKKTIDEENKNKKKKEKRKLKLSEMDPEDLILRASEKGRFDLVEYSLNKNGSLHECQDLDGYTPLHRASYGGHLEIVKLLVSRGANTGARTIDGWEPLHSACRWGKLLFIILELSILHLAPLSLLYFQKVPIQYMYILLSRC